MTRFASGFDRVTHLFSDAGFEAHDAEGRARLLVQALDAFTSTTERAPAWSAFVPGRIEIFGKHTDYAGGRSLTCAVPRGFIFIAAPREDRRVRVVDGRLREEAIVDLDARPSDAGGWPKYVEVVVRRLAADFPGAPLGLDIAFASDLPRAAGLSSSSALVVGLATALMHRANLHLRPEWRAALHTLEDLAGYFGAMENGLTFKTFTGAPGVGTDGGSEDHTAILMGRVRHVSAYSYLPVRRHADAEMPPDWRFVVAASGIEADKAGSARDLYNQASRATRELLAELNVRLGGAHPHLAAALEAAPAESIVRLRDELPASLSARCTHFMTEDARVPEALDAFRRADRYALAELSERSQEDAETLLGNQIQETVALARLAREHGAFAACSFGAGFGGSVWTLIDRDDAAAFAGRWMAAYAEEFPSIQGATSFVCRPAPAALELAIDG